MDQCSQEVTESGIFWTLGGIRRRADILDHAQASSGGGVWSSSNIFGFRATIDFDPRGRVPACWISRGQFDDRGAFDQAKDCLEQDSAAWVIPDLVSCSPPWWDEENQSELVVWGDGKEKHTFALSSKETIASLGSRKWRDVMRENLRRFVEVWEAGPYGGVTPAYCLGYGTFDSWIHHGSTEGYFADYNPYLLDEFRIWLGHQYGTVQELEKAWGRSIQCESDCVPTALRRMEVAPTGFRDPVDNRDAIDFEWFLADFTATLFMDMAEVVKLVTQNRKLFGARYGDFMNLAAVQNGIQNSGCLGLGKVLDCEAIDFLVGSQVDWCGHEDAVFPALPAASCQLHGKAFFLSTAIWTGQTHLSARETRANHGFARGRGYGSWSHQEVSEVVSGRSKAEVAFVLDDLSFLYVQRAKEQFRFVLHRQALELAALGIPFDFILQRDLYDVEPYRFLMFPNTAFASDETRQRLPSLLSGWKATALWLVAPGFANTDVAFENAESLTGFKLHKPEEPHSVMASVGYEGINLSFGTEELRAHTPFFDEGPYRVMGRYVESGLPALGECSKGSMRSIFSAVPGVPAILLRKFCFEAGVSLG